MSALRKILEDFENQSHSQREKGYEFEKLTKTLLQHHPQYRMRFEDVWLWNEWPQKKTRDIGIDLVAKERNTGELCAIQCKFYKKDHVLQKGDIDSFLATSRQKPFQSRLVVATVDQWSKHAEEVIQKQSIPCERLDYRKLAYLIDTYDIRQLEKPKLKKEKKKTILPHQKEAVQAICKGFSKADRGKVIMACGTGKTYTALQVAEEMTKGISQAKVLFVVPSLSLLSQAMREWAFDKSRQHIHFAVCSDTKVGKDEEDTRLVDLGWPATTDAKTLVQQSKNTVQAKESLTVIFSTYQSLDVISKAQKQGLSEFDLVICDEAHRTTGIEKVEGGKDPKVSLFSKIHDKNFIQAKKRLYMTATPRLYHDTAKLQAKEKGIGLFSMDDPAIYGEEFYRLDFSKAVDSDLLSDYKVLILSIAEEFIAGPLQNSLAKDGEYELSLSDGAKLIGCWNGLRFPEGKDTKIRPLKRAVAFHSRIQDSKTIKHFFPKLIQESLKAVPLKKGEPNLRCEVEHVDGTMNALERNRHLDWLRADAESQENTCRILTNARCLSEGIDVPALDAVLFLQPRSSQVDIVQAVGRVMRKAPNKDYGYIILPIVVPAGVKAEEALDNNKNYATVWNVLQALRAHDARFDATINQLDLNVQKPNHKISNIHIGEDGTVHSDTETSNEIQQFEFDFKEWHNALYAKIVDKCGDRRYWETWAKDVAHISTTITTRIEALLKTSQKAKNSDKQGFAHIFAEFLESMQKNINPSIDTEEAISMLAQHTITQPVFDALFENYKFSKSNPVSISMGKVISHLEELGLKSEIQKLEGFYKSVHDRASGVDNLAGKQKVITELYDKFFSTAFPKVSEKLGIVYTPIELVDFVLRSTHEVLQKEFQSSLGGEGVHILDPFTGTGSFIVRLLQNQELLPKEALERKYKKELHANEIMLLAYYIASINIEEAYHQRSKQDYEPFSGIVLTDTFQISENENKQGRLDKLFPANSQRVEDQKKQAIRVIFGNPPWSAGQKNENDANKNIEYENLDQKIRNTYLNSSLIKGAKNSLYDSYVRAIRWASDRLGKEGVIAYVTNGSFIDGNATDGLRKCLVEEFDSIYCFNLRGNARTSGDLNKREGGLIFNKGRGSKATIAITLLIKKAHTEKKEGTIYYHDIGDYLSREEKLKIISENSLASLKWKKIQPNKNYDWINQRDVNYQKYLALGTEENKKEALNTLKNQGKDVDLFSTEADLQTKKPISIFGIYSRGIETCRDAWVYNFSQKELQKNMKAMIAFYNEQGQDYQKALKKNPNLKVDDFVDNNAIKISWSNSLKKSLENNKKGIFSKKQSRTAIYRPFVRSYLYYDLFFHNSHGQFPLFFPQEDSKNLLICTSGRGAKQFSTLMVNVTSDLNMLEAGGQCFALYVYDKNGKRHDNISDACLEYLRQKYDGKLSKEDIFYYVYALLHWPVYREKYASDLVKNLARIPFVAKKDFPKFVEIGRQLGALHINYEKQKGYPVKILGSSQATKDVQKMNFLKDPNLKSPQNKQGLDKTKIQFNHQICLEDIPLEAYDYVVNGKPAIEWLLDRYRIKVDKDSEIKNDPNEWEDGGKYILSLLKKVITVSVESVKLIKKLEKIKWENGNNEYRS